MIKIFYMAGADIQDCFYAVRLPAGFEQFFVLPRPWFVQLGVVHDLIRSSKDP